MFKANGPPRHAPLLLFFWKLEHENTRALEYSTRLDSAWLETAQDTKKKSASQSMVLGGNRRV